MDMRELDNDHVEEGANDQFHDNPSSYNEEDDRSQPHTGDGASPGKIFVGGLARETAPVQFVKHFEKYGEITDSVIMKDRRTGQPRGFGFITYADSSVVDKVIEDTHVINGKQVEIKRTIPKGAIGAKDFKTKKIFVGGIPTSVTEDEFKEFFAKFGDIREHQIMRDHSTNRSRGFGFVTFDDDQVVDNLLSGGNRIEFAGTKVEIKKAEPKKPNAPPLPMRRYSDTRSTYGGGFGDSYGGGYGGTGGGFGPSSYRAGAGAYGGRSAAAAAYGGYGGGDFGGYGGYGGSAMGSGAYRGADSYGYMSRYSGGAAGYSSRGYDMGASAGAYGGAAAEEYGGYGAAAGGGAGYGGGYYSGFGSGGPMYGSGGSSRGGYGGGSASGRFHPYGR